MRVAILMKVGMNKERYECIKHLFCMIVKAICIFEVSFCKRTSNESNNLYVGL